MAASFKPPKLRRVMHPNSLANLEKGKFPKGYNGNRSGYSLLAELKHALNKAKRLELVNSTIEGAILREPTPFKELWDRLEGKVLGDQPLVSNINVVFVIGRGYRDAPRLGEGSFQPKIVRSIEDGNSNPAQS